MITATPLLLPPPQITKHALITFVTTFADGRRCARTSPFYTFPPLSGISGPLAMATVRTLWRCCAGSPSEKVLAFAVAGSLKRGSGASVASACSKRSFSGCVSTYQKSYAQKGSALRSVYPQRRAAQCYNARVRGGVRHFSSSSSSSSSSASASTAEQPSSAAAAPVSHSGSSPALVDDMLALTPFVAELDDIAPSIDLDGSQITILDTPTAFYQTLKTRIRNAQHRIFLSTLYVGKEEVELVR